jgi:cysteine desulfurase / selenocysteine lyase
MWRADVPALHQSVHGHPLVYLDNASTTLKPRTVIDAVDRMLSRECANVHRGVHSLSEAATASYEAAREKVARTLRAQPGEIIFTRGTTESINLVAQTLGRNVVQAGDSVLVTEMEHHSNLVPWQILCRQQNARLEVLPVDDRGVLRMELLSERLHPRTKLVAVTHVSNVLGTINPVAEIVKQAHACGALVIVDGAQALAHLSVDVQALGCDFYAFSAHKMFGPPGVGVLWGRAALLDSMPPWQGGGDMVLEVQIDRATYQAPPHRFEAGTPNIAGVVGLGAAADHRETLLPAFAAHEHELCAHAMQAIGNVAGVRILGTAPDKIAIVSFTVDGVHPHDVAQVLDHEGIAVRAGHHCAQPLMTRFGVPGTVRASFAYYNTLDDIEALVRGLGAVREAFA